MLQNRFLLTLPFTYGELCDRKKYNKDEIF